MNPTLRRYFQEYADAHRHPINRLTHKVAIPLIVFHIVAMLDWLPLFSFAGPTVTLAHLVYAAAIRWYWGLHRRLAIVMAVAYGVCFPLGWLAPKWLVIVIAIFAWIIQLAGHAIWEKSRPAFLDNMLQALIGPMFFAAILLGEWPPKGE